MHNNIIDGKKIAEKITDEVKAQVGEITRAERRAPGLAIVLAGEREDSKLYVSLKEKAAKKVGVDIHVYKCSEKDSEEEIVKTIEHLNQDDEIDAILVQLPLPENLNTDRIIKTIDPAKDVDRFHPDNLKVLLETCNHKEVIPPVLEVVLEICKEINFDLQGKKVCVISNSEIFGRSLQKVLECQKAGVSLVGASDGDLIEKTSGADLLISAVGRAEFIGEKMVKDGAVVIDIGITKEGKEVVGDVNFEEVKDKVSFITPVPGGVGPMTVAMLLKNVAKLYNRNGNQLKEKKKIV